MEAKIVIDEAEVGLILPAIVDSSNDAIISKTLEGIITSWNSAAEKIFGYTENEMIGKNILTIIPAELMYEELDIISHVKSGQRIEHFETVRIKKDGSKFPVAVTISPVRDSHGVIKGASKILRDITGEKILEEQRGLLAAIVSSSDDAVISKNLDGIISSWNRGAENIFGFTAAEAIGQHISIIIPNDRLEEETVIINKIRSGEKVEHLDTIRKKKSGEEIHISVTISPVLDKNGKITGASKIARDITARIKQEEETKLMQAQLEQLNNYKDEFMAIASHELRTPITIARISVQMADLLSTDREQKKFLDKVISQIDKLSSLIDRLLDTSKVQYGILELKMSSFNLFSLVNKVADTFRNAYPNYKIDLKKGGEDLDVWADRDRIEQVINNLMSNAVKYSSEHPEIIIELYKEEQFAGVKIADKGIGISEADKEKLFNRFFRAAGKAATFTGTGVGLYISKEIIGRHNGKIWVTSEENNGSTFYFNIPLAK